MFVAVLFIVIMALEKYHGEIAEQCPAQQPTYGKALNGFTFKTLLSLSVFGCLVDCHEEDRCQSYNYVIKQNICEMNNRTKEAKPEQFVSDPDRFYMKRGAHRSKAIFIINVKYYFVNSIRFQCRSLYSQQCNSVPSPRCLLNHAGKSKQMKEDKRSAVTRGWIPLVLERSSWLIVTWKQKV